MPEFELIEVGGRCVVTRGHTDVDPRDEEACVGLLRATARTHHRKPSEVTLKVIGSRHIREYRTN